MEWYLLTLRNLIIYVFSVPVLILLTPFRWIFDTYSIKFPDIFRTPNNPRTHKLKVEEVQAQVKLWNKTGKSQQMCTARPTWQTLSIRNLNKRKFARINVDLEDIIQIDANNRIIRVEPGMKMGTLTHKLLSQGWTIPVIPEFESLTIGGCINGTGIETSSHKYGLFADTCVEFELVMADGSILTCSKKINSDLFYGIPWSHGTIAFLTAVAIPIQPAPKFVKLEYHPTDSLIITRRLLEESIPDFVEGIMFDKNKFVVLHGSMVDTAEYSKINNINRWYKPWFYKHVERMLENSVPHVEYIPIRDYYHRHQRSYFWELDSSSPLGKNAIFRLLFGWIYPLNFQLIKFLASENLWDLIFMKEKHVLQDFLIPVTKLGEILEMAHNELEVYPIWLCPCKFFESPGLAGLPKGANDQYIDVGIYGMSPKSISIEQKIRKFEKFVTDCRGFQFLYADSYLTHEEFGKMFHLEHYQKVRNNYKCEDAFPEVYDKVSKFARKN